MKLKYTKEMLEPLVRESTSFRQVIDKLGIRQGGGTQANLVRRIKAHGLDTSHFLGQAHGRGKLRVRLIASEVLVNNRTGRREHTDVLRRVMLESGVPYHCELCPNDGTWQGRPIVLEIDHRNGNNLDNRLENLRFLCPNCHSQQVTDGSKNIALREFEKKQGWVLKDSTTPTEFMAKHYEELANKVRERYPDMASMLERIADKVRSYLSMNKATVRVFVRADGQGATFYVQGDEECDAIAKVRDLARDLTKEAQEGTRFRLV